MTPSVSVVIPVFNAEHVLGEAIASVLAQTFADFELIVVNDGSTDNSATVCAAFEDDRIRLISQENRGLAGARNTGVRYARGRYVAFLDADDRYYPEKLERHVRHFEANPYLGISFSHSLMVGDGGRLTARKQCSPAGDYDFDALLLENPIGNGSAAVFRKRALGAVTLRNRRNGRPEPMYFDERLEACEDVDLLWRIAARTPWKVACLPEVLTVYNRRRASFSADTRRMARGWEQAVDRARIYAPSAVQDVEHRARARFHRYLAGRAVADSNAADARYHIRAALAADRRLLVEQPRATLLTLGATAALRLRREVATREAPSSTNPAVA